MMSSKIFNYLSLALLGLFILNACSSNSSIEDPVVPIEGNYQQGFFVVNEGQFPNPGRVDFVSENLETLTRDVFREVNGGEEDLGGGVQSLFFDQNDRAYIISNSGNFITVVDRYSFEKIGRIETDLSMPRYGVAVGTKAYVTNQGDFTTTEDDYIAVIDLDDFKVEKKILTGGIVERVFDGENGYLYIEGAAFGMGNQVFVFDVSSEEISGEIETAAGLNSIALENSAIYALTASQLQKFEQATGELVKSLDLDYSQSPSKLRIHQGELFYTVDASVYSVSSTLDEVKDTPVLNYQSDSEYGVMYGFEVHENRLFIADGGDFASDSFIEVYDWEGNLLKNISVGIAPNGFYFNE